MVIVVEPFPKRKDTQEPVVGALFPGARNVVRTVTPGMRGITNKPLAEDSHAKAATKDAGNCGWAQPKPDERSDRQLLKRPGGLEKSKPWVAENVVGNTMQGTLIGRFETEMQRPPEVPPQTVAKAEISRAIRLILPVISHCMKPRPGNRPSKPGQDK